MNEKNEIHNRNLHISGLLNEEKVDSGDTKVDIENEKVDIQDQKVDIESVLSEKGSDFSVKTTAHIHRLFEKFGFDEVFFTIWCRQILLNRYPVTEKENINSKSKLYSYLKFYKIFLEIIDTVCRQSNVLSSAAG